MNKPAAKEPSMDEILSSIRQIIADDDADVAAQPAADEADDIAFDIPEEFQVAGGASDDDDSEALELSQDQIVEGDTEGFDLDQGFDVPDLSDIIGEDGDADEDDSADTDMPDPVLADDIAFGGSGRPDDHDAGHGAAAMPDPALSSDMAEQLLEPATDAAVRGAFARLGNIPLGNNNMTLENMVREMLRPMLKEWLDENLPSVVEKMVEKEIERLSRG